MTIARERRVRAAGQARSPRAERRARAAEALELVRLAGFGRAQARPALRRPAPARRARARDRQPPAGAAARRAARRARPQAAPGDAGRAQAHPARGRHHVRLRHARPGGGADHERPPRRLQPGPDRAGRAARRGLRAPGERVRRRASSASRTCSSATGGGSRSGPRRCGSSRRRGAAALHVEAGAIRDVAYAGDGHPLRRRPRRAAGSCRSCRQNLETSSAEALEQRGREVSIGWREEHTYAVEDKEE